MKISSRPLNTRAGYRQCLAAGLLVAERGPSPNVGVVRDQQEEPNRVLGFPVGPRQPRPPRPPLGDTRQPPGPARPAVGREGDESQRVLGFPVDWFRQVNLGPLRALARRATARRR